MGLFDIFKKKKASPPAGGKPKEKEKEVRKTPEVKVEEVKREEKKEKKKEKKTKVKKISEIAPRVLKEPHITEKATFLTGLNQYVFKVYPRANKNEIKKAIKELYEVDVLSVKIINISKKRRRLGRISGFRKGYKKAIIKIKEGQKIEAMAR